MNLLQDLQNIGLSRNESRIAALVINPRFLYSLLITDSPRIRDVSFMNTGLIWREVVLMSPSAIKDWVMQVAFNAAEHLRKGGYRDESYGLVLEPPQELESGIKVKLVQSCLEYSNRK
jgi:hypothetical protein